MMIRRTITTLLLVLVTLGAMSPSLAQSVETIRESPLIRDYLALDRSTGDLYVSDYQGITRVAPDGTLERIESGWSFITGLAVTPGGDLLFSETNAGKVFRRDEEGVVTEVISGLDGPVGIWMCPSGDCFYTQTMNAPGVIYRVTMTGGFLTEFTGLGAGATDIAVDPDGNFYVAYFQTGVIQKVTPSGDISEVTSLQGFVGYITYAAGSIYATAWQRHQILRIDPNTGATEVVAGTGTRGSTDGDALTTAQFNDPNGIVASVTGDTLYISQNRSRALRMIVGVNSVGTVTEEVQPTAFVLDQNYPNPFSTTTQIPYRIDRVGHVDVSVFDLAGRRLATLVSGVRTPGAHQAEWDASGLPAGLYLYRIRSAGAVETRRMSLVR